jgi:sugar/nucleoside kinase (ribokinase family)
VHLGASVMLGKEDVIEEDIRKAKVLHLEAFQLEGSTKDVVQHAIDLAKKHNTLVSIDLADSLLIKRNLDLFKEVLVDHVDILFCNEEEAKALTGKEHEKALKEMGEEAPVAVLKLGEKGSLISVDGEITEVGARKTNAVDTTGAGDSYASGFLFGYTNNWTVSKSGKLGSHLASEVISRVGVDITDIDTSKILEETRED